ncbi:MAG: iron ABC transporter substrate-binding protein, partial [Actinomycetota bacterium]
MPVPTRARRRLAAAVAAVVTLSLAACGSGDGGAAGGDETALTIYSGRNENLVGPLLEQLEEAV